MMCQKNKNTKLQICRVFNDVLIMLVLKELSVTTNDDESFDKDKHIVNLKKMISDLQFNCSLGRIYKNYPNIGVIEEF